ncbi:hypothetical protein [Sorangium sp. So ce131]|uniref:hypothetical protein n=1 Tax=Sorangium sp. So ce131 TaxID=3133282 RepID=UPI003F5E5B23
MSSSSAPPPAEPGKNAAVLAQRAVEDALALVPEIPFQMDRAGVGERLRRAVQCGYAVLDSDVLAPVHHDGLTEAAALVREARALLAQAGDRREAPALDRAIGGLDLAASALALGATAVAQIQLARRSELTGGGPRSSEPPRERPFRASQGTPSLHAFARRPLVPELSLDPVVPLREAQPPPRKLKPPATLDALKAFAAAAATGELEKKLGEAGEGGEGEDRAPEPPAEEPPRFVHEPAIEEAEMLRRLGRDCLEDIAIHRDLRKPNAIETWLDQEPFEQRLLDNLDCFASVGAAALPLVSLYFAEAKTPDPGRAFAVALTLGAIEGRDTVDAAVATLKHSAPETYPGWIEGLWLAPNPEIDAAMVELATGPRAPLAAVALEVLALRQAVPFDLASRLAWSERPELAERAVRALAAAGPRDGAVEVIEGVLARTGSDAVFLAAAEAAMRRGHGPARSLLRATLSDRASPARAAGAAWLLCLGGHGDDLGPLLAGVAAAPSAQLVRGLGRFGHVGALGFLVSLLGSGDEPLVEAAAEALERITGAGLRETVEEPWEVELPPEVEAAVEAEALPIPVRKVEKVVTDPARWEAHLRRNARRFDPEVRMRGGRPFTVLSIVDELEARSTPPPRRHEAVLELWIATGMVSAFSPDDWVERQRAHLAELRERVSAEGFPAGRWAFGLTRSSLPPPPAAPVPKLPFSSTMALHIPAAPAGALPFAPPPGAAPPRAPSSVRPTDDRALPFVPPLPAPPASSSPAPPPSSRLPSPPPSAQAASPFVAPAEGALPPAPPSVSGARSSVPAAGDAPSFATTRVGVLPPREEELAPPMSGGAPPAQRDVLPFKRSAAAEPAPAGADVRQSLGGLPFKAAAPAVPASADVSPPQGGLPFKAAAPAVPAGADVRPPQGGLPFKAAAPSVPSGADARQSLGGLPFRAPVPAAPTLTLEQHAWISARRVVEPARSAEVLAQQGIAGEDAWLAADRAWQQRLSADRALYERWLQLIAYYRGPGLR